MKVEEIKVWVKNKMNKQVKKKKRFNRYTGLLMIMVLVFSLLIREMVNLQVVHGESYYARANVEFIKNIDHDAPRGEILDKDGHVLATSLQSYNLIYVDTTDARRELYRTIDQVRLLLEVTGEEIRDTIALKTDPFRFEFGSDNPAFIRSNELRFKKDRGINDRIFHEVMREKTGKSRILDLNEQETKELDELILAVSPMEMYYYLIEFYRLYEALPLEPEELKAYEKMDGQEIHDALLTYFDWDTIRDYLIVVDSIRMESYSGSKAVTLVSNMQEETAFTFLQQLSSMPGIDVETNPIRLYPYETLAANVLGYLNPIPAGVENRYRERGYDISKDLIGVAGIESAYESWLRGTKGVRTVEVDKNGRTVSELFALETYPGSNVKLTLDLNLQNVAEKALADIIYEYSQVNTIHNVAGYEQNSSNATRGAVVVLEVDSGNVLAMASHPRYDPNVFAVPGRLTSELYEELLAPDYRAFAEELIEKMDIRVPDPELPYGQKRRAVPEDLFTFRSDGTVVDTYDTFAKPLYNYATQGNIPSASTFKLITGLAALEENIITKNSIYRDTGSLSNRYTGKPITNDGGFAYGDINIITALAKSSNTFFAEMGYRLYNEKGLNAIANWAWKLGMGHDPREPLRSTTGIEIFESRDGNVYNHYSKVAITQRLFMFEVVETLRNEKGLYGFKGVDIGVEEFGDPAIEAGKEAIKVAIREALNISLDNANAGIKNNSEEMRRALKEAFEAYFAILPEDVVKDLSPVDEYIWVLVSKIYNDKSTELLSPRNVMNSSIGQGENENTLLQIANALATIVNGGTRYKTTLIDSIIDAEGEVVFENEPVVLEETGIKSSTVDTLLEGLRASTLPGGGSYNTFKDFPIATGGKTGTGTFRENPSEVGRDAFGLYTAVAPMENPEIVVAVVVYDVSRGAFVVPVSLAIFEEYFKERLAEEFPEYERQYEYEKPAPITTYEDAKKQREQPEEEDFQEDLGESLP
ncbi:MAG TPA: hypothetical protein DEA52_03025 [Clostridiaceae bacterium]|nr:hypothetical protein [Clostridiaceae bacterium]